MAVVHLVLNAHIDPVWLWPWQAGADEVVATCRSACERLDRHPDLIFTRGEAWAYSMVERIDPPLFRRILRHVEDGRWEIVGGWWIQPDCNLPTGFGLAKQIELGRDYFLSRFGRFPRVGYNVDSFGHSGFLPRLMNDFGQDRYVMMRPQEHELEVPARCFRWLGAGGAGEVTAFRIAGAYQTGEITREHVERSLRDLPTGATHTMCFIGLGDHGGGPTERQIAWCRENARVFEGHELVFSSPSRFFDAIEAQSLALPTFEGELQQHAPGCYSVERKVKTGVRRAEHALVQADVTLEAESDPAGDAKARLEDAWRDVAFSHFHDTLGGTSIPSAYVQVQDQLGRAAATADELMQLALRRRAAQLASDGRQRIVLFNASDAPFDGWITLAPWTEAEWEPAWRLVDEAGASIPYQLTAQEALTPFSPRLVVRTAIEAGGLRSLFIDRDPGQAAPSPRSRAWCDRDGLIRGGEVSVALGARPRVEFASFTLEPDIVLYEDPSDTWSHALVRFDGAEVGRATWDEPLRADEGPFMAAAVQHGSLDDCRLSADWRVFADEAAVELVLDVDWRARRRLLKLVLPLPAPIAGRIDGVLGGAIERRKERRERPLQDFTLIRLESGARLGVVCPDVFAIDADESQVRLTLLRSPFMAHHDPADPDTFARRVLADQGPHRFRFQFLADEGLTIEALERRALMLHRPPLACDSTKGMAARSAL